MNLYVIEFYREFEQSDRDWDVIIGEDQADAIERAKKYFKEELEHDDSIIEDMDIQAYPIPDCHGYDVTLTKQV